MTGLWLALILVVLGVVLGGVLIWVAVRQADRASAAEADLATERRAHASDVAALRAEVEATRQNCQIALDQAKTDVAKRLEEGSA